MLCSQDSAGHVEGPVASAGQDGNSRHVPQDGRWFQTCNEDRRRRVRVPQAAGTGQCRQQRGRDGR